VCFSSPAEYITILNDVIHDFPKSVQKNTGLMFLISPRVLLQFFFNFEDDDDDDDDDDDTCNIPDTVI